MSAVIFWWPARFKNLENPDFKNLNQLQKTVALFMDEPYISHNTNTGERSYFRARSTSSQVPIKKEHNKYNYSIIHFNAFSQVLVQRLLDIF